MKILSFLFQTQYRIKSLNNFFRCAN